jgi:signal transduction histidine kinase
MLILSLILVWFGIQWRTRFSSREEQLLGDASLDGRPVEASLAAAMSAVGASSGVFAWREKNSGKLITVTRRGDEFATMTIERPPLDPSVTSPLLYALRKNRGVWRDDRRNVRTIAPRDIIGAEAASALDLTEGLAIPVYTSTGDGVLFLQRVRGLSIDHLDLGDQVGAAIAVHMQRHALLRAAEDSAAARSRLSLARDLHDSVVQFLAGAAFRLEALRRGEAAGADLSAELDQLKQLMLEEQGELRSFVAALRSGSRIALDELAIDLRLLAERLAKHWSVECAFSAEGGETMVPTRLHLDAQQLVREAVANAVRHAGAKSVKIRLGAANDELKLEFINDGSPYPKTGDGGRMPRSLRERVEEAGGALELSRGMGVTKLSIALPMSGARQ